MEDSDALIDGFTETVKHKEKTRRWFLEALPQPLATLLVQPVIYSVVKCIRGKGVIRAKRRYINKIF